MDWSELIDHALGIWGAANAFAVAILADPLWRLLGLSLVVAVTIWAIAQIYSGDLQNSERGPIAVRPHVTTRANHGGIVMPRDLGVPFNMDGVNAGVTFLYVYDDARGKRRKVKLTSRDLTLSIQPYRLGKVQNIIYGHEVPDVPQESVCYPQFNLDAAPETIGKTAERAPQYVEENKLQEVWTDDDNAVLISVPKALHEELDAQRTAFITDHVAAWEKARDRGFFGRGRMRRLARRRPNVIGSYYLQFKFKADPLFVLFRHPDRDLKMTAWLTVLTSAFALLMDAWPKTETAAAHEPRAARTVSAPRVPGP